MNPKLTRDKYVGAGSCSKVLDLVGSKDAGCWVCTWGGGEVAIVSIAVCCRFQIVVVRFWSG